jgi:hypothetical protein
VSHKYTWLFSILGVALCSGLASAQRTATVVLEIPGYKHPSEDHGRNWYVYLASADQSSSPIVGASGVTPGILCQIPESDFTVSPETSVATFQFTLESTEAAGSGCVFYIAYGFAPTGSCCVNSDCADYPDITQEECVSTHGGNWYTTPDCPSGDICTTPPADGNPLTGFLHDIWFVKSEFIFYGDPNPNDQGDISYVAEFSHPLAVDVYGSDTVNPPSTHRISRTPDQMVKQILINDIYNSNGFRGADGTINTTKTTNTPPVWMSGVNETPANTKLWQDPNVSGQSWDPHGNEAGFIRLNQPNVIYPAITSGNQYLPGYHDAMDLLHQKYPTGGTKAILVAGNFTAVCNSQANYAISDPHQAGAELCIGNSCPSNLGQPGEAAGDLYRVWARVGKKSGEGGSPVAYWFEVTATNPASPAESGFIKPSGYQAQHCVPNGTLYIPQIAQQPSSSTTDINNHLYGRLVKGDATAGAVLTQMQWGNAEVTNVFQSSSVYTQSATAMVRDICATVSNGQLGSSVSIGYAFGASNLEAGFFWVGQAPNKRGVPIHDAQYSTYYSGSNCCCVQVWTGNTDGSHFNGFSDTSGHLATGQMQWLNNWFDDLASPSQMSKPWNDSYAVMFDNLGSGVYTSNYTDYYKYYQGIDPQFESNSHRYMKYVFKLGTMTFADFTNDGKVGVHDLLYMLQNWGHLSNADLNSDQKVNAVDMILLLNNWTGPAFATGACCINQVCSIRSSQDCLNLTGTYKGNWTHCDPNPCSN